MSLESCSRIREQSPSLTEWDIRESTMIQISECSDTAHVIAGTPMQLYQKHSCMKLEMKRLWRVGDRVRC